MSSKLTPQDSAEQEFADELKPGTELLHGQYVIEQFLNNGGFGITYLAKDSLLRRVVIKECFPEAICRRANSTVRVRSRDKAEAFREIVNHFIEEARGLARLSHPNIVGVHQVFEDNDTAYMAMDFVEGRDLLEIAETSATIEPRELEIIAYKLLDAVGFIHHEGVLHRDISPDNILLGKNNEPVLIDFGAARETVTRDTSYLADLRTVKDGYSPQEFYIRDSEQHQSSDLYSLAASLYHVMTKTLPVSAQERMTAIAAGDPDPYVSVKGAVSGYSDAFLDAIDHALSLFHKHRIQSAGEWRAMLAETSAAIAAGGAMSRPILAAENGNLLEQFEEKERKSFLGGRKKSAKQLSVRSERPASYLAPSQRDAVSSQAEVARAMEPSGGASSGKGLYLGVAAVAVIAVIGAGAMFVGGGSEPAQAPEQVAVAEPSPPQTLVSPDAAPSEQQATVEATTTVPEPVATQERIASKPEQMPFFLAESSQGDVVVSSAGGSRSTASETGPLVAPQPDQQTASQPVAGAGVASDLATAQPVDTDTPSFAVLQSPVDTVDSAPVISGTVLEFDVTAAPTDPLVVRTASGPSAEFLEPGLKVVSVNGFPLEALSDFQRVAEATADFSVGDTVSISFGIENPSTGETYIRTIALPAVQQTLLQNGVSFEAVLQEGGAWATIVRNGAGDNVDELQTGDKVVALMPNNELIDDPDTLPSLLRREIDAGATRFNFAVSRDGEMWLVSLPYAPN
ncbi:MAG: protein kinase [Pseudomonadota bacterium]